MMVYIYVDFERVIRKQPRREDKSNEISKTPLCPSRLATSRYRKRNPERIVRD